MQLSRRLQAVVDMVTPGNRVADIGCDHAYTTIYLLTNNISPYVVAMDINQGPLDRAKENVKRFGVEDKVSIRKSDGLVMLNPEEVDTILIAGMGGRLMLQILTSYISIMDTSVKELVLQPQSDIHIVRRTLTDLGFFIINEDMLKEDGKYYVIMKLKSDTGNINTADKLLLKEEHYYFGRLLLEENNSILLEYLNNEKQIFQKLYNELNTLTSEKSIRRQTEIDNYIQLVNQAICYYTK